MKPTRAIVFDAFGTLIRYTTRPAPYGRLVDAAGRLVDRLACLTRNVPMATFAAELGAESSLDIMEADLAEELSGLRLAVCSNLAYEYGPAVRGLVPELDAYVFSYEVGVAKPHPTMYRLACAELGCAPAETVFVGDSKRCDFDGPQAFGMQARWLDRRGGQSLVDALKGVL